MLHFFLVATDSASLLVAAVGPVLHPTVERKEKLRATLCAAQGRGRRRGSPEGRFPATGLHGHAEVSRTGFHCSSVATAFIAQDEHGEQRFTPKDAPRCADENAWAVGNKEVCYRISVSVIRR